MLIKNQEIWDKGLANNQDPYGARIYSYAKDWAELMEKFIKPEASEAEIKQAIADHAEATGHEADTDGITGFMYGAAVSTLAHVWLYGDQLRRWHNLKTQLGHEGEKANETGGTLNPALLKIGGI